MEALRSEINIMMGALEQLTGQSRPEGVYNTQQTSTRAAFKYYSWIRQHSMEIHDILKEKLLAVPSCACCLLRVASMHVTVRTISTAPRIRHLSSTSKLVFNIALSFDVAASGKSPPWE